MANITLRGNTTKTYGDLPVVGSTAPDFQLTNSDLEVVSLSDFSGKKKILNIFPSTDTATCALSVKTFGQRLFDHVHILNISRDTPFALSRFCETEGIKNSITLSDISHTFGKGYGVEIIDGPLIYFLSRAVVVLDENNKVLYTEQVSEIAESPNFDAVIQLLS